MFFLMAASASGLRQDAERLTVGSSGPYRATTSKKTQPDGNGLNRSTICLLQDNLK
jgi:hypothetical protein